jgi:hypothetical protein
MLCQNFFNIVAVRYNSLWVQLVAG